VAGEAGDDVCLPGSHRWRGVGVGFMMLLLSLGTPSGRTGGVVSVGVCAVVARERRSPLDGENRDELDAAADRYRGARYERTGEYDVAERHRHPECRTHRAAVNVELAFRPESLDLVSTVVAPCHRPRDRLPSIIDGSRSDESRCNAGTGTRKGPAPDYVRRAQTALAGDLSPAPAS
jgi:hypothetical protein